MILSDKTIRRLLEQGTLRMQPLSPGQIQPASVDVRLGDTFGIVEDLASGVISMEGKFATRPSAPKATCCCQASLFWRPRWNTSRCRTT